MKLISIEVDRYTYTPKPDDGIRIPMNSPSQKKIMDMVMEVVNQEKMHVYKHFVSDKIIEDKSKPTTYYYHIGTYGYGWKTDKGDSKSEGVIYYPVTVVSTLHVYLQEEKPTQFSKNYFDNGMIQRDGAGRLAYKALMIDSEGYVWINDNMVGKL